MFHSEGKVETFVCLEGFWNSIPVKVPVAVRVFGVDPFSEKL